jgi:putative transposase
MGLARWQEIYQAGGKPNWRTINADVNARKVSDLAWLKELPWAVPNNALQDLNNAFAHFFRRVKAGEAKAGYPRFKSKKRTKSSFAVEGRALTFDGRKVKVPKLGWVRTRQELRFPGKVLSALFCKSSSVYWYLAKQVEVSDSWVYPHRCETQAAVGIDLGVQDLAVLSTGERVEAPRSLRRHEPQLRRLNKELSRRKKGGTNWRKTMTKLARVHERIANIRHAVTHELTADVVRRFRLIGVEDLNVQGMASNGRLAKSVMDAAMGEVLRQLAYKAPLAGSTVVRADRWFPSSKTCHACGLVRDSLPLGTRRWTCECGAEHDRDENAAENLRTVALTGIAYCPSSSGVLRDAKLPVGWESSSQTVS